MKFIGNIKDWAFIILGMFIIELLISMPYLLFFQDSFTVNTNVFSTVLSLAICFWGGILYSKRYKHISNPDIFLVLIFKITKDLRISNMTVMTIISFIVMGMIFYLIFLLGILFAYKFLNKKPSD